MSDIEMTLPDQKELEKEIGDYLTKKYGEKVKIVSTGFFPEVAGEKKIQTNESEKKTLPFDFHIKPEDLISFLDEYIIKQDRAKAVLATKVCTHFNRIRYIQEQNLKDERLIGRIKNNILLMGPTGVGKTFLIKLIAQKLGVPFIKGDATKFSETGYVGGDVDDLVRDLVREADGDIERAQYGIIYVDEIDKIAHSPDRIGLDVSRSGVQRALLKPMEETEIDLKVPHDMISQIEAMEHFRTTGKRERRVVNTKNILFIMSGAFNGLDDIISKRLRKQTIGFEGDVRSITEAGKFLKKVKAEDLVSYGFESEFVGRLPIMAVLDELEVDDLEQILLNPNCAIINAKKQDFMVYGINLCFEENVFRSIAVQALKEKTGARGLVSVIETVLLPFEKRLPSTNIKFLAVNEAIVKDPEGELATLLASEELQQSHQQRFHAVLELERIRLITFFRERKTEYLRHHNITVTEVRLAMLAELSSLLNKDSRAVCDHFISLVVHIKGWQEIISDHCGLTVELDDEAIDHILALSPHTTGNIDAVCEHMLQAMEHGLKLLEHKKHPHKIIITAAGVDNPEKFINDLVEQSFKL